MEEKQKKFIRVAEAWNLFQKYNFTSYPDVNLCHYTPNSFAVEGVLQKKEIWLSPHDDMNDPSEIEHGMSLAIDVLKEMRNSETKKNKDELNQLIGLVEQHERLSNVEYYMTCFTEAGPNDVAQWREYGNKGNGYCIEFDNHKAFFDPNMKVEQNRINPISHLFAVRPVIYDDNKKIDLLKRYFNALKTNIFSSSADRYFITMFLKQICIYFKHNSYSSEKEWRTVLILKGEDIFWAKGSRTEVKNLGGFFKRRIIIPLPSQQEERDSISKIFCGPKQNDSKVKSTQMFVDKNHNSISDNKIIVEKSEVPMN